MLLVIIFWLLTILTIPSQMQSLLSSGAIFPSIRVINSKESNIFHIGIATKP